jgi:hypothetical protein
MKRTQGVHPRFSHFPNQTSGFESHPRALSRALALAPTAALAAGFFALAWREQGSIVAEDWLAYALATALLLATVLLSGTAQRPPLALLAGLGALTAFALWTALSAQWSPVPALARDEGLLVLFYALALASAVATLRSDGERVGAVAIVVGTSVLIVVATAVRLITSDDPGTY